MSHDAVIYTALSGDSALTALVTNIYMGRVPKNASFPVVWLWNTAGVPVNKLTANDDVTLRNLIYDVNIEAGTYTEAWPIAAELRRLMTGTINGTVEAEFASLPYDEDTNTARLVGRFSVHYSE